MSISAHSVSMIMSCHLGSISNCHHLKFKELNSLTVGMYVWPEQENGDSIYRTDSDNRLYSVSSLTQLAAYFGQVNSK